MSNRNDGRERPVERVEIDRADQLFQTIEEAAERGATRIQLGEGEGAIVLAEADRRRWRKCGDCTLCCTLAGVNELKKPPGTPCRHLKGKGCGIYPDRPNACRDFACGWLLGNFDERFRPDKIGAYAAFFVTAFVRRCGLSLRDNPLLHGSKPSLGPAERGVYAVIQCQGKTLNRKRLRQMIDKLNMLPEIRVIVDDREGLIFRQGEPMRRFRMLRRPAGDFETAVYMVEEQGSGP
jgi:hypothetical protein